MAAPFRARQICLDEMRLTSPVRVIACVWVACVAARISRPMWAVQSR